MPRSVAAVAVHGEAAQAPVQRVLLHRALEVDEEDEVLDVGVAWVAIAADRVLVRGRRVRALGAVQPGGGGVILGT